MGRFKLSEGRGLIANCRRVSFGAGNQRSPTPGIHDDHPSLCSRRMLLILFASFAPSHAERSSRFRLILEWRPLFDGRSLDGWEHVGPGKFVVEDGLLRTEGGMGLLWYSREKLGNCVIRVVYKTANDRSNSGVYHPDRRSAQGPVVRGPSRFRGPDHGPSEPAAAAPARSTRSPRRPPSRQSPANGTRSKSP